MGVTKEFLARLGTLSLDELVEESLEQSREKTAAEERQKALNDRIRDLLLGQGMQPGQSYIRDDGAIASVMTRTTSTIEDHLLIQKGVDIDVIKACTVTKTSVPYVQVRKPSNGKKPEKD